jgi:hypothetical protein
VADNLSTSLSNESGSTSMRDRPSGRPGEHTRPVLKSSRSSRDVRHALEVVS